MSDEAENVKLTAGPGEEAGPVKDRKCTDCLFALLIIASWVAMTVLGLAASGSIEIEGIATGDPQRLLNGVDYDGRICGVSAGVEDAPDLYNLEGLIFVCLPSCPTGYESEYCEDVLGVEVCAPLYPSTEFLNRCILTAEGAANATSATSTDDSSNAFSEIVADLYTAKGYIGGFGFVVAAFFGFVFLRLLQHRSLVACLTWSCVLICFVMIVGVGATAQEKVAEWQAEDPQLHGEDDIQAMQIVGYLFFGIAALYALVICFLRSRINLAVSIVAEASTCVSSMPTLVLFPLAQAAGMLLFLIPWLVYCLYLASSGDITTETYNGVGYKTIEFSSETQRALIFMLFNFFWTGQFIVAMGQIVVAMAVCKWYFTRDRESINSGTVVDAVKASLKHVGTAAFGSLIIAIIQTVRAVLTYVQHKAQNSGNKVAQFVLCCLQCCLACVEKLLKFLNKNAYVMTALYGTSFCSSAKKAFWLILRNIARVGALSVVGEFVMKLLKLSIMTTTGATAYYAMAYTLDGQLNGLVAPTICACIVSWFTADMFLSVLDTTLSALLMCVIADEELYEADARYAPASLAACLDSSTEGETEETRQRRKTEYELTGQV